jgi:hypothetical protein
MKLMSLVDWAYRLSESHLTCGGHSAAIAPDMVFHPSIASWSSLNIIRCGADFVNIHSSTNPNAHLLHRDDSNKCTDRSMTVEIQPLN